MMEYLDDLIGYVSVTDPIILIRIFWFFFFFEFSRFFVVDFITISTWFVKKKYITTDFEDARKKLHEQQPFVSVIIPGKNEGKHIHKLTKTLSQQTYKNFELIIIDDGSDDDTPIICRNLEKLGLIDAFYRNDVRGGKASAANLGLRFAKGSLIVHLDADCSFDDDAIENVIVPFYMDENIGAVGGNVMVRNYRESLCATLQAMEYMDSISIGRISTSELGIYRIVSGAFGAFRKEVLDRLGGWDIGPGLDGDITVKFRKLGYRVYFEPSAVCHTAAPATFKALAKQRLRWDKSLVRFRLRKHKDVFFPHKGFNTKTFLSFVENITYNIVLDAKWWLYVMDMIINFGGQLQFILPLNILLYTINNYVKFIIFSIYRERRLESLIHFLKYVPLMVFYFGYFLRVVRTRAYIKEFFFKESYDDPWNPKKSSNYAKELGL